MTAAAPNLRPCIRQQSDWLDAETRALVQERDDEAECTEEVCRKRELRDSAPGIGVITALNLLLPEERSTSRENCNAPKL